MESLQIRTGQISLQIIDDEGNERGVFRFNPEDVESAKRVVLLQQEFNEKQKDFELRAETVQTIEEKTALLCETVEYLKSLVDGCFGKGSSDILFGDNNSLSMFDDFFSGIIPYYEKASKQRMAKYRGKKAK